MSLKAYKGAQFVQYINKILFSSKGFEQVVFNVDLKDGGEGKCHAEFEVQPDQLNPAGELHQAYTATVIDMVSTYALMSKPSDIGVSLVIDINYLTPAKVGDYILVDAEILRSGRNLSFLECELKRKSDGAIIARGNQTKFITDKKSSKNPNESSTK